MNNAIFPNKFKSGAGARYSHWQALPPKFSVWRFDWLVLDGEHAPNDVTTLIPQLMGDGKAAPAPVVRANQ